MSYLQIASIIENWAMDHNLALMVGDGEHKRRHFHVSSELGETFQVVVEPEREGFVRLDAHLIESPSDEEAHFVWEVPTSQTLNALDMSLASTQAWFQRMAK